MHDDPEVELTPSERELADRLSAERPLPAARFRGALARHLAARDPGYGPRPAQLHLLVSGYLLVGVLLTALGVLLAVGGS